MDLAELSQAECAGVSTANAPAAWEQPTLTQRTAQALGGRLDTAEQAPPQARAPAGRRLGWRRALAYLVACLERVRQRQRLMALDDRMLKDVGLTRSDALAEYRKPFWR